MKDYIQTLHGSPVTISQPVKTKRSIKRTWKERLFTLPFSPSTKYKEIEEWWEMLEDGVVLSHEEGGFIMNSVTWKRFCDSVDKGKI